MNVLTSYIQEYEQAMSLNSKSRRKTCNNEVDAKSLLIECPPNQSITLYNVEYTTWSEDKVQQKYKPQGIHRAKQLKTRGNPLQCGIDHIVRGQSLTEPETARNTLAKQIKPRRDLLHCGIPTELQIRGIHLKTILYFKCIL